MESSTIIWTIIGVGIGLAGLNITLMGIVILAVVRDMRADMRAQSARIDALGKRVG